jgi:hypothetical protein
MAVNNYMAMKKYNMQWMEATVDGMGATKKRVRLVHW